MDMLFLTLGGLLVGLVGLQVGLVALMSVRDLWQAKKQQDAALELLRQRVEGAKVHRVQREQATRHWNGNRKFVVFRKVAEADNICSFHLLPHDRKLLPPFQPGQYLTFRLEIPGRDKPVVRCYSLSDCARPDHYRVTIKRVPPPPDKTDAPPGLISNYFHEHIHEGDILDVQAPHGQFVLDPMQRRPVVLIAGGVGITPMLSMVNAIAESKSGRETWLFYGVRNRREHAMAQHLRSIAAQHENIHVINCYSHPTGEDVQGRDYQHAEWISVKLMQRHLKSNNYQYFICGPPLLMQALTTQLNEWGVPQGDIMTEAFGPATVSKAFAKPAAGETAAAATAVKVTFDKSHKSCTWDPNAENLLDFALNNGVHIDSGCRAGNCGTCLVALKLGNVNYLTEHGADVEDGACLTCISAPNGDVVLDA